MLAPLRACVGEVVELAGVRSRQDQRPVLGADGVVGRDHAAFGSVARKSAAVTKFKIAFAAAKIEHEPPPCAFDFLVLLAAGAAHDRRDRGERARAAWAWALRMRGLRFAR